MSFQSFVGGTVRIVLGWIIFFLISLASIWLFTAGYMSAGVIVFIIALFCGVYAEHHRGKQGQRVRDGGNTYR